MKYIKSHAMTGRAWMFAVALLFAGAGLAAPSAAQTPVQLTPEVKQRLMASAPMRDRGIDGSVFDGKPILVVFFASWCPPCFAEFAAIRDYIDAEGKGRINVIAVNWIEDYAGASPRRLRRMLRRTIHPAIRVVKGTPALVRDFDGVHSIPAAYIFDGKGREVFRVGGDPGPHGRRFMNRRALARAISGIK